MARRSNKTAAVTTDPAEIEQPAAATGDATADEPGDAPESPVDTTVTAGEANSAATPDAADPASEPAPPAQDAPQGDAPAVPDVIDVPVTATEEVDAGDVVVTPAQPSIDSVMGGLLPASAGAVITRPEVYLTGEQATLQLRVYETLSAQGKTLRGQGDVYGWLLGQILEHLA